MKIKIYKSANIHDTFETDGIRVVFTLKDGSQIVFIEPQETDCTVRVYVDGELAVYPRAGNTCEIGIKEVSF